MNSIYAVGDQHFLSSRYVNKCIEIYVVATLFVLVPACLAPLGWIASIGFLIGCALVLASFRDSNALLFYFIILLLNNSIVETYIVGTGYTITSLIYLYSLILFIWELRFVGARRKILIATSFIVLWIIYRMAIAHIYSNGAMSALWGAAPLSICITSQILIKRKEKYKAHLLVSLYVAILLMCITGYVELIIGRTFFYSLWKGAFYRFGILRVGSTVADANFLCLIEVPALFIFGANLYKQLIGKRRIQILSIALVVQIVLTFSRTGILALIACYVIYKLTTKKYLFLIAAPLVLLSAAILPIIMELVLKMDVESTNSRMRIVTVAIQYWLQNPIVGHGPNAFYNNSMAFVGSQITTMNVYVEQLVCYGAIGLAFYILYAIFLLKRPIISILTLEKSNVSGLIMASLCAWLIISYSLDTFTKIYFWIIPAVEMILLSNECPQNVFLHKKKLPV